MKGPYMEYGHGDVGNGMSDPKPVDENEFAEYMWMGEELDEFDQQVEQQLMEEFLIETCVEQMLRDDDDETIPPDLQVALNAEMMRGASNLGGSKPRDDAGLANRMADLTLANRSRLNPNAPVFTLNPNASVFVPRAPASAATSDSREAPSRATSDDVAGKKEVVEESAAEVAAEAAAAAAANVAEAPPAAELCNRDETSHDHRASSEEDRTERTTDEPAVTTS